MPKHALVVVGDVYWYSWYIPTLSSIRKSQLHTADGQFYLSLYLSIYICISIRLHFNQQIQLYLNKQQCQNSLVVYTKWKTKEHQRRTLKKILWNMVDWLSSSELGYSLPGELRITDASSDQQKSNIRRLGRVDEQHLNFTLYKHILMRSTFWQHFNRAREGQLWGRGTNVFRIFYYVAIYCVRVEKINPE